MASTKETGGVGPRPNLDLAVATRDESAVPAPVSQAERKARAAAAQNAKNPDAIAAEIEQAREDLAVTVAAIADRVSPKKVVGRTKVRLTEAVKGGTATAVEQVKTTALTAKEKVTTGSVAAKDKVVAALPAAANPALGLPSASGVAVPDLPPPSYRAPLSSPIYTSSGSLVRPEYVAAGLAAALVAWLLVRRQR